MTFFFIPVRLYDCGMLPFMPQQKVIGLIFRKVLTPNTT